jgi:hypothetical protein
MGERKTNSAEMLRESAHRACYELAEIEEINAALIRAGAKLALLQREENIDPELPVEEWVAQLKGMVEQLEKEHEGAKAFLDDVMADIDKEMGR